MAQSVNGYLVVDEYFRLGSVHKINNYQLQLHLFVVDY